MKVFTIHRELTGEGNGWGGNHGVYEGEK